MSFNIVESRQNLFMCTCVRSSDTFVSMLYIKRWNRRRKVNRQWERHSGWGHFEQLVCSKCSSCLRIWRRLLQQQLMCSGIVSAGTVWTRGAFHFILYPGRCVLYFVQSNRRTGSLLMKLRTVNNASVLKRNQADKCFAYQVAKLPK